MMNDNFYGEVLTEHFLHPLYKYDMTSCDQTHAGVNPSCGDSLEIKIKYDGDRIDQIAYAGAGCAVSQAAADLICELVTGKTKTEARQLLKLTSKMASENLSDDEKNQLGEVVTLAEAMAMPLRVKCALLAARTVQEMLDS